MSTPKREHVHLSNIQLTLLNDRRRNIARCHSRSILVKNQRVYAAMLRGKVAKVCLKIVVHVLFYLLSIDFKNKDTVFPTTNKFFQVFFYVFPTQKFIFFGVDILSHAVIFQLNVAQMDVFSRLMMDRIIFLGTQVDDYSANVIQAQLLYLDSADPSSLPVLWATAQGQHGQNADRRKSYIYYWNVS